MRSNVKTNMMLEVAIDLMKEAGLTHVFVSRCVDRQQLARSKKAVPTQMPDFVKIGFKFFVRENQVYGSGHPRSRIPRRVERVDVEYEVISDPIKSLVDTIFVWVKASNGKNAGQEFPFDAESIIKKVRRQDKEPLLMPESVIPHGP